MDEKEVKLTTESALSFLREKGYVLWKAPTTSQKAREINVSLSGKRLRFGVLSDTHLGSQFQQITYLRRFYSICARRGIKIMLHCGDLVDGNGNMYRGQIYEQFALGADNQIEYAVNNYPRYKDMTTYALSGNHDASFQTSVGIDVVQSICRRRNDMEYLGFGGADIRLMGVPIYLLHCDGGLPYARSYRLQKIVEQFPGGKKPRILAAGHLHVTDLLPNYRNVMAFLAGAFQSQTPYLRRKGLAPDIGGSIVEVVVQTGQDISLASIRYEWIPFYDPIENDY